MYVLIFAAGFASAVILLLVMFFTSNWYRMRHRKKKNVREQSGEIQKRTEKKKVKIDTYCKAVTAIVIGHGLAMITMSYILSWFSRDTVADVSIVLITEVVSPLCLYLATNCIMNIFEKNELIFSTPIQMQKVRETWDKTHEDMEYETGGNAAG